LVRPSGGKSCKVVVISIFLSLGAITAHGEPVLASAQQLEKAGDQEGAARLFSAWLAANPGASGSAAVFEEYLHAEHSLQPLFDESARFLRSGKGVPGAAVQFERIAHLYDMAGRLEEARDAYLAACSEGGPPALLVSAFLLSLEMNDSGKMTAILDQIAETSESSELLRAILADHAGDPAARMTLLGIADETASSELALKALWLLYEDAKNSGDAAGQAVVRSKLAERFAAAPETSLAEALPPTSATASRPIVVQLPAPGHFEGGSTAPAETMQPQTLHPPTDSLPSSQTAPPSSSLVSVQAGSFVVKENADDLMSELARRGFVPVLVHEFAKGKDRYRVLAGSGLTIDAADGVIRKLSDAGFRGFLVQEK
jgi:cell division protein FtsN